MEEEIKQIETISVPETPVQLPKKNNLPKVVPLFILGLIILAGAVYAGVTIGKKQSTPKVIPQVTEVSPTPDETANWKTAAIGNVSFKYPPNWDNPETVSLGFGSGLDIKSSDNLYRLTFSTGISKGSNLEDLEKFIDDLVSGGGEKISVDNNLASVSKVEYQGVETITTYIISPTKDRLYALSLSSRATSKEIRNLFDQILSTFKFLDQKTDEAANWKTYTSTNLGFTFRYPTAYSPPEERENYLSLVSPLNTNRGKGYELQNGELKIEIVKEVAKENDSPVKCWNDHNSSETETKIINQSEIVIGGINATILDTEGIGTGQFICMIYNKNRYLIQKYPLETTRQTEFDQILSTFKFLD